MQPMLDGIEHLGSLCERIRLAYSVSRKDIALKPSVISDFERYGNIPRNGESMNKYLKGLKISSSDRGFLLREIFGGNLYVEDYEDEIDRISFKILKDNVKHDRCDVINSLADEKFPAFIHDNLWFIHAMNQNIVDLFKIDPNQMYHNWFGWHVIGSKYCPGSLIRKAHGQDADSYFSGAVNHFFRSTANIFFTKQMRALRNKLWILSNDYQRCWNSITKLSMPFYNMGHLSRIVHYNSKILPMYTSIGNEFYVNLEDGYQTKFTKIVWVPRNEEAWNVVANISQSSENKVYLAADYEIQDYNEWSELQ